MKEEILLSGTERKLTNYKLLDSFHDLTMNNVCEYFFFPNEWIVNSLQRQENLGITGYNDATLIIRPHLQVV